MLMREILYGEMSLVESLGWMKWAFPSLFPLAAKKEASMANVWDILRDEGR